MNDGPIINKVAESGLVTLDLETFLPREAIAIFDMKDYLFMGMILKEKDFREALKNLDLGSFKGKLVGIICSADAIIPLWAYMLVGSILEPVAVAVFMGNTEEVRKQAFIRNIQAIDTGMYKEKRIVIKGCGDEAIGDYAYLEISKKLRPVVKSLMYGEACSTVPIYKSR